MLAINSRMTGIETPQTFPELLTNTRHHLRDTIWNKNNEVVYLGIKIEYRDKVSCSHSAPKGEHTNWGGKSEYPAYFPGWSGRIWIGTLYGLQDRQANMSSILKNIGLYTGTGGGGNYNLPSHVKERLPSHDWPTWKSWGWDVKIWEADWPEIKMGSLLEDWPWFIQGEEFEVWTFSTTALIYSKPASLVHRGSNRIHRYK